MALGKGLGALITPTAATTGRTRHVYATGDANAQSNEKIWQVPVTEVKPGASQPRKQFNETELQELAASIKEHGILQPLLVTETETGGYELVAGERRWRAAQIAGLSTVPVVVKKLADQTKIEVALIENIQRQDLNAIEEAFAYKRLAEEFGMTQEMIAKKVGKSRPAIANAVRLLELPDAAQVALASGKISAGQGRALLSLHSEREQLDMLKSIMGEKVSVREMEHAVREKKGLAAPRKDANMLFVERKLGQALDTRVTVAERGGRGTVQIAFFSKQELAEIVKKITGD